MEEKKMNSQQIEGRHAVMEAFRSGKPIDTSEPDFRDRKTSGGHCTGSGLRVCAGGRHAGACKTERGRSFPDPSGQY